MRGTIPASDIPSETLLNRFRFYREPFMVNRRQHPRWDGRVLIDLEDPSGFIFEAVGLNISAGGMCLIFPEAPAPVTGASYVVSFFLPNLTQKIENEVEVRWVDTIRSKICGVSFVHGLRAVEIFTLIELKKLDS